jgi:hypothetical protein
MDPPLEEPGGARGAAWPGGVDRGADGPRATLATIGGLVSTITLLDNWPLEDDATADETSTVGEPSVSVVGSNAFVTGNW